MAHVDLASIRANTPAAVRLPALLDDFAGWLGGVKHGTLGYFDTLAGDEVPEAFLEDDVARLRAHLAIFLGLPDGSYLALWDHGAAEPAVVKLGSEGDHGNVADTFAEFLLRLAAAKTDVSDLDDSDASASRPVLAAWLEQRGLRGHAKRTAPNFAHWLNTGEHLRTGPGGGGDVSKLGTTAEQMVGRQLSDPEVAAWLEALDIGKPVFAAGETTSYLDDLERGCCVLVEAPKSGAPSAWIGAVFFYAEGADDHTAYAHALPRGVAFTDTPATLATRLGPPESERKRKTGELRSQNWEAAEGPALNITYAPGGAIENIYMGSRKPRI